MIIYSIYRFVNRINGKCYVGYTQDIERRITNHRAYSKKTDNKFYRAVRKYGWDNFDFQILYQSKDGEHCLNVMEPYFITEYNSCSRMGYNSATGGQGGSHKHSDKTKLKLSELHKGKSTFKDKFGNIYHSTIDDPRYLSGELVGIQKGIKPSAETIEKYKIRSKGNQARLGIPHSEDVKKIISERTSIALKGKKKNVVSCPYCGKSGGQGNMKRYHFDNCKHQLK